MKPRFSIEQLRAAAGRRQAGQRRWRRAVLWTALVLVVLVLFGFFGLPPIVKSQATKRLSAQLGREVTIERVRINPLVLSTTIEGLAIKDRDGGPFIGWRRLYVNFDSFSLFTGEWRFQEIVLDEFAGRVALAPDGTPNFADLLPAQPAEPAPAAEPGRPLYIGRLVVGEARVDFADQSRAQPFATEVGPLTFTLMRFRTSGDPRAPYSFDARTEAGETLAWRGTLSIAPLRSTGELALGGIALKKYAPYYGDRVGFEVRDGLLDVRGRYEADFSSEKPQLRLAGGELKLHTFQLAAPGAAEPSLILNEFSVEGVDADLARLEATIARVVLAGGQVTVQRDAQGIDLLRLLTPPASETPAAAPAAPAAQPPSPAAAPAATGPAPRPAVRVAELAVSEFAATLHDRTTPRPAVTKVERLDLTVREFNLADLAHALPVEFQATLAGGGAIKASGTIAIEPLAATMAVDVQRVALTPAEPYVEPFLNIRLAKGHASLAGNARFAENKLNFEGDASVDELLAVDGDRAEDFVSWSSLAVKDLALVSEPLSVEIAEITWTDPTGRVLVHPDRSLNLNTVLRRPQPDDKATPEEKAPPPPAAPPAAGPKTPPPPITIGRVTLQNAGVQLADRSVKPNARLALTELSGTITGLSSAQLARADVDLRGTVDGSAPVVITGRLNPLGEPAYTDLKIDFRNIELLPIGPYVAKYAGYELSRGSLTLDVNFDLEQRKITSANIATLDQFTLGARTNSPDATKLPVTLAIALLKDRQGRIVIDLPVQGSLDDPSFRIGRVVMRVITNLLAKAATSPFALLGAMFGGGGEELGFQLFTAGESTLLPNEIKKLDTVAKALIERPALRLDLEGGYDPAADAVALQRRELERQVRAFVWEERRLADPATPPPAEMQLSAEDRAAAIARMFAAAFPDQWVTTTTGPLTGQPGSSTAVPPGQAKPPGGGPTADERSGFLAWLRRIFGRPERAETPPAEAPAARPGQPGAPAPDGAAPEAAGPTPEEMEAQLAQRIQIDDEALRELAAARVQAVKDHLLQQGKVPADRVFLVAPAPKGPRVNLQLK